MSLLPLTAIQHLSGIPREERLTHSSKNVPCADDEVLRSRDDEAYVWQEQAARPAYVACSRVRGEMGIPGNLHYFLLSSSHSSCDASFEYLNDIFG
jgi:hypothetical protein